MHIEKNVFPKQAHADSHKIKQCVLWAFYFKLNLQYWFKFGSYLHWCNFIKYNRVIPQMKILTFSHLRCEVLRNTARYFCRILPLSFLSLPEIRSSRVGRVVMNLNQRCINVFIVLSLSILIAHATTAENSDWMHSK